VKRSDQGNKSKPTLCTARRAAELVAPCRGHVALAVALTSATCLLNLTIPVLVKGLVDGVVGGGFWAWLPTYTLSGRTLPRSGLRRVCRFAILQESQMSWVGRKP
jgi:hypothetical protein